MSEPLNNSAFFSDDALESQILHILNSTNCPCFDAICESTRSGYLITIAMVNKMKLTDNAADNNAPAQKWVVMI